MLAECMLSIAESRQLGVTHDASCCQAPVCLAALALACVLMHLPLSQGTSEDYKAMQKEIKASGAADAKFQDAANARNAHKDPMSSSGNIHGREGKY